MSHPNLSGVKVALVLSGGNALGAYQAGAYQALYDAGIEPDWVAGASVGSVNGAILCGNPPAQRLAALERLWRPSTPRGAAAGDWPGALEDARRTAVAAWTMAAGKPEIFTPRHLLGPWWNPFGNSEPASLYDTTPLRETLLGLVDFDRLNRDRPRYSATAVDIETGEDVVFDTRSHRIEPDHIRASSALLPAFSPVKVGDRWLGDAGISANLPLDGVLSEVSGEPVLCIAIDLLPLQAPPPRTLGESVIRMQDLMFATQSRRAIASWQAIFDDCTNRGSAAAATIVHIAYSDHDREVSGKAFDFSPQTVAERWQAGLRDMRHAIGRLAEGRITIGEAGLAVYALAEGRDPFVRVRWPLAPVAA
ncbi:patatin-like phospholipase family protein [Sphingomonas sp.]|uniref:patatin-like phospholipase family protein n=1 Tax=Sphingomonas sp. TaxID=28214 RepID=UPI003B3B72BF